MIAATLAVLVVVNGVATHATVNRNSHPSTGLGWPRAQSRNQPPAPSAQQPDLDALEQAVAANPNDSKSRELLADAYIGAGRPMDAVAQLRTASTLAPRNPAVWYALGQAYNAVKQDALRSFGQSDTSWRALLSADALSENGHLVDAFTLYRGVQGELPAMANIHDSVARIYDRTGHTKWATTERARGRLDAAACGTRKALCEFRLGRFRTSLEAALAGSDPESRYWQARAANELALAAFNQLDTLPDSPERRTIRAAVAQAEERYIDAVAELEAATKLAPRQPELLFQLASAYYSAQDFDNAIATLAPLLKSYPNDPRLLSLQGQSFLQLQRPDEAVPIFEQLVSRTPRDPRIRLFLGRAYFQGAYYAEAVPLLEEQLPHDSDGSVHVQLARAYTALGQRDKAAPLLTKSQELQKADEERRATLARRTITAPK
jgi:tetratricopeptide (TPR) repeat protein